MSELDELLLGALDAAVTKYLIRQFDVLMSEPTDESLSRFMLGLAQAVAMYMRIRPLILTMDDESEQV